MRLFILSFILVYSFSVHAVRINKISVQYAGEIGLLAFGVGKNITPRYSLQFFYGYVPNTIAGKEIETYSFKNNYIFKNTSIHPFDINFYGGMNIYHVIGLRYQTSRFASYPRNYYRTSSVRALLYLGLDVKLKGKNNQYYFETGINDIWLINYYNNPETIKPQDYVSLAFGWNKLF